MDISEVYLLMTFAAMHKIKIYAEQHQDGSINIYVADDAKPHSTYVSTFEVIAKAAGIWEQVQAELNSHK